MCRPQNKTVAANTETQPTQAQVTVPAHQSLHHKNARRNRSATLYDMWRKEPAKIHRDFRSFQFGNLALIHRQQGQRQMQFCPDIF